MHETIYHTKYQKTKDQFNYEFTNILKNLGASNNLNDKKNTLKYHSPVNPERREDRDDKLQEPKIMVNLRKIPDFSNSTLTDFGSYS